MSNFDLTKQEIMWLMETYAPVKENCGCGQDPCKTYGANKELYSPEIHGGLTKDPKTGGTRATGALTITGQLDHEVSMASRELDKTARYAQSLAAKMDQIGEANLPAWVQSKITKAADYVSKVYHYLEEYLESGDDMMAEAAEGEIKKASHDIQIDVNISKEDMKDLHDGKTVVLKDTTGNNTFIVNLKA